MFTDEGTRGEMMMLLKGKAGTLKNGHVGQVFCIGWSPLDFPARRIIVVKWV